MIHAGDTIENPVTGERILFLETSRETVGEAVRVEVTVEPDGAVAAAHVHPYQTERFEVLEGALTFQVAGRKVEARAGDVLTVEPGQAHRFENAGDQPARFRCTIRPALQFEQLIETMFTLAAEGKTNR
jgi:quercetin dioxygenase-like cupin family protein